MYSSSNKSEHNIFEKCNLVQKTCPTWVFESGRSHGSLPFRRNSAILALSLWARTIVRGIHSSVSSVAYPNIRPCERCSHKSRARKGGQNNAENFVTATLNINSWTPRPGHRLPHPPLFDPGEHLEQCRATAAPKPPAHCRSYSQSLENKMTESH